MPIAKRIDKLRRDKKEGRHWSNRKKPSSLKGYPKNNPTPLTGETKV